MPEEQNNNTNEQQEPADSGRDADELRSVIQNLTSELTRVREELQRKEPEAKNEPVADWNSFFAEYEPKIKKEVK